MSGNLSARGKRALLIGIDKYPWLRQLDGCVNDVTLMGKILQENFGFPTENLVRLADGEATREAILAAMDDLVERTRPDDIVVIHYAGHGSQMTDREGNEPDGMDETIMPFDSQGRAGINRDITDDEIHLRLVRMAEKTSFITLIFDSCHSGTVTRDAFGVASRFMEPDTRPVAELPLSPIPPELRRRGGERGPSGWMPLAEQYVLLAGCRDEETSYEYRPPEGGGALVHGALTYFLARELSQAGPGTSYRDVFERAAAGVNAVHPNQHPQMEGRSDREVFGVDDVLPMRFVPVRERAGDMVVLGAGAAHGMTVGSVWDVYPQGTKLTQDARPLGRVEITRVRAVTAEARVSSESAAGTIARDARAIEAVHDYGQLRLAVQLAVPDGYAEDVLDMRKVLEESRLLREAGAGQPADARIYLLPPRARAQEGDPVPQLGALDAPVWCVIGPNGQPLMPSAGLNGQATVCQNLEKLVRQRQALQLDNPDPGSALRGKFSLELLRRAGDRIWVVGRPEDSGGEVVYEDGESIAFRITSRHAATAFVYLLDFDVNGAVTLVHPPPGGHEKLEPGRGFEVGTGLKEDFVLRLPEGFGAEASGLETVKLFVTNSESDFGFLMQEGFKADSTRAAPTPLMLLWQTATGATTRGIQKVVLGEEDWTTVRASFVLRKRRATSLDPSGAPLALGDSTIRTPGLTGSAELHIGRSGRAEADELTREILTSAMGRAGVAVRETIELGGTREAAPGSRAGAAAEIELTVPDPGLERGQMVLTTDELGVVTWHFAPVPVAEGRGGGAATSVRTYRLPVRVREAPPGEAVGRSLVGAVGRKFLKVLVFQLIEPGIGPVTESFAQRWEEKHRPYRLRHFGPDNFDLEGAPVAPEDWARLGSGRALLLIHGTFSRTHTAFGGLPREYVQELHDRYDTRVFAFDHFTLSHDPRQNVEWLLERVPDGCELDLDIICHSRGGLVARMLSEKQGELSVGSRRLRVNRVVFVGSPNAGTILANADHVGDFLDSYTNLLNFIPDAGMSDVLAGIITVAKQLAVGAVKGLRGLQSMRPGGEFGKWLNTGPRAGETRYFALASDYMPGTPGLKELATDRLMDRIFRVRNDLVVPTDGVFGANGSGFFPIEEKIVFQGGDAVGHTGYFANPGVREKIAEWLGTPAGVPVSTE